MAITSGSYTIGTGGNYSTLESFFNDIPGSGLTGNMIGTIISNITITTSIAKVLQLNTYSFTLTSNKYHYGYFGSHTNIISGNNLVVYVKNGKIYYTNLAYNGSEISFIRDGSTGTDKYFVSFCLFRSYTNAISVGDVYCDFYRNIFIAENASRSFLFYGSICTFENNDFIISKRIELQNGTYPRITFINSVFNVLNDTITIYRGPSNTFAYGYKSYTNKSDLIDAFFNIGVGNVVNVSYTSEFLSTDYNNVNYLKITNESTYLKNTGNAPTLSGNNYGIRLNATPHNGYYSVGADDYYESVGYEKIRFTYKTLYVETYLPLYPYTSYIKMPFDKSESTNNNVLLYDYGSSYDKRWCICKLLLNSTEVSDFNTKIINKYYNDTSDTLTIEMGTRSCFYPFGHDYGCIGPFDVKIDVLTYPKLSSEYFNMFEVELKLYLCGAPPSVTFETEQSQGSVTIGSVTGLKFPQNYYQPKRNQEWVNTELQGRYSTNRILKDMYYVETIFDLNCNISKMQRLLQYITSTNRANKYNISSDSGGYIMGYDNGTGIKTIYGTLLNNELVVTTNNYNNIDVNLSFGASRTDIT